MKTTGAIVSACLLLTAHSAWAQQPDEAEQHELPIGKPTRKIDAWPFLMAEAGLGVSPSALVTHYHDGQNYTDHLSTQLGGRLGLELRLRYILLGGTLELLGNGASRLLEGRLHVGPLIPLGEHWGLYARAGLGMTFWFTGSERSSLHSPATLDGFLAGLAAGVRRRFGEHVGAFLEVGGSMSGFSTEFGDV